MEKGEGKYKKSHPVSFGRVGLFVFPLESLDAAAILNLFWSGQQAKEGKERRGASSGQERVGKKALSPSLSTDPHP